MRSSRVEMDELGEIRLGGGRINDVVRVGETVRRPLGPHSAFVHEVLLRLEEEGFEAAPRFLGVDESGREILSLLPGAPLPGDSILPDDQLRSAARLLRGYHDAVTAALKGCLGGCETIVHGDVGPWNLLWLGSEAVALIDFDNARPGARLEDVAYLAWKGLRLVPDGPEPAEQRRRLAVLAHAYEVPVNGEMIDAVDRAMSWMREKGVLESWPMDVLRRIDEERRWLHLARWDLI